MTSPSVPTNDPTEEPVPDAPEFRAAVKRLLWRLLVKTDQRDPLLSGIQNL